MDHRGPNTQLIRLQDVQGFFGMLFGAFPDLKSRERDVTAPDLLETPSTALNQRDGEFGMDVPGKVPLLAPRLEQAFTVRRYASATTRLGRLLAGRGAHLVVVTDQGTAPLARNAPTVLRVPTRSVLPFGSFLAMTSLTQALVVATSQLLDQDHLARAEGLLAELETFEY